MMNLRKTNQVIKMISMMLVDLPSPSNISFWWNFGSLLGGCLIIQIISGVMLSLHYSNYQDTAFSSIIHIIRNVNNGWLFRTLHLNGASLFFICLYLHMGRGIYYHSFSSKTTWMSGSAILFLIMAIAFMGYVLPWGQMSFWGATVITNLISVIPMIGPSMVNWIWGGFSVSGPTLTRFFSLHFLMPFALIALVVIHLMFLHQLGSNNPMGTNSNLDKIPFHPFFSLKDLMGFLWLSFMLTLLISFNPYILGDCENFSPSNPLITPIHIQPEWYFLFAYAILRSIPNKTGGVVALLSSILIFTILPLNSSKMKSFKYYKINKMTLWAFMNNVILLTWAGAKPVEPPFIWFTQIITISYFMMFIITYLSYSIQDNKLILF